MKSSSRASEQVNDSGTKDGQGPVDASVQGRYMQREDVPIGARHVGSLRTS